MSRTSKLEEDEQKPSEDGNPRLMEEKRYLELLQHGMAEETGCFMFARSLQTSCVVESCLFHVYSDRAFSLHMHVVLAPCLANTPFGLVSHVNSMFNLESTGQGVCRKVLGWEEGFLSTLVH